MKDLTEKEKKALYKALSLLDEASFILVDFDSEDIDKIWHLVKQSRDGLKKFLAKT